MSKHCSVVDLYNVIVHDDCDGLENAIFLLGPTIHFVRIWCDLTPILYSARLGHVRQVGLLFTDLDIYFFRGDKPHTIPNNRGKVEFYKRWEALLYELILSGQTNSKIAMQLLFRIVVHKNQLGDPTLEALVRNDAITLLQKGLMLSDGAIRTEMIRNTLLYSRTEVFKFCEEGNWIIEVDNLNPLSVALLRRNKDEVNRLIDAELATNEFDWELFLSAVVRLNDEEMLDLVTNKIKILQTSRMEETIHHGSSRKIKIPLLLAVETAFIEKLDNNVLHLLNSIPEQVVSAADWTTLYLRLLLRGVAGTKIKHLTTLGHGPCQQLTFWEETVLPVEKFTEINSKISLEDFVQILAELESVPFTLKESAAVWQREARMFPIERGRPDLIPHVQNYNPTYEVKDVLEKIPNPSAMLAWNLYSTNPRPIEADLKSMTVTFLGCSRAAVGHHVEIDPYTVYAAWHLFHDCVLETGKRAILGRRSDASESIQERLTELDCRRKAEQTLQKTCRLVIRRTIITRIGEENEQVCLFGKLWDDIMSLYVDGYSPRRLVSYLLYQSGERPVQRRLSFLELAAESWKHGSYTDAFNQLDIR